MGGWERKDGRPPGWLPPSPACTQGLPTPMCALRLLAASPPRVSTPLWPISSIFITFCNARSRVPNLKSTLFPNVFVTSIPRPSGRAFPNAELLRWGQPGAQCPELSPGVQSPQPHLLLLGQPPCSRLWGGQSAGDMHSAFRLPSYGSPHAQLLT